MPDIFLDVDVPLSEVPVNLYPLTSSVDQQSIEAAVAYNAAGLQLFWNFITSAGQFTRTQVTPTSAGVYDWVAQGGGLYTIEIPASGGASINNDTEGVGFFTGVANGILPWRGPTIGFRSAALNAALMNGGGVGALPQFGIVDQGVAQSIGAGTIQLRAAIPAGVRINSSAIVHIRSATTGAGQTAIITAYNPATQIATISPAWGLTPTGTVEYQILAAPAAPSDSASLPAVRVSAMDANTVTASAVAADAVAEIQTGLATASGLTSAVAPLATAAALATVAGYVDTEVAAIKAVTDKVDTALEADGGVYRLTANALELAPTGGAGGGLTQEQVQAAAAAALAAYDAATGADVTAAVAPLSTSSALAAVASNIATLIGNLNDVTVQDILTTQMAESYAANGTAPTLAQILFAIHQHLMDFAFNADGTTRTVNRLNGTVAFVETVEQNAQGAPMGLSR